MSFASEKISFHYDSNKEVYVLTFKNNHIFIEKEYLKFEDIDRFYKNLLITLDNDKSNDESNDEFFLSKVMILVVLVVLIIANVF
jgi:hypothetical protein